MTDIKDIHAEDKEGVIVIQHPVSGAKKAFLNVSEALAWGNPSEADKALSHPAIALAAEGEDHKITVMRSYQGELPLVRRKAVEWKDVFLASRVYVWPEPAGQYEGLLKEDGLIKYQKVPPYVVRGRPIYRISEESASTEWPSFRNRRTRASVIPHDKRLMADFESAAMLFEELIKNKKVNIDLLMAPGLEASKKKDFRERLTDLPYRAMVGVVWEMFQGIKEAKKTDSRDDDRRWNPWRR